MLTSCLAIFHWVPTGIESETGTARNTCLSSQSALSCHSPCHTECSAHEGHMSTLQGEVSRRSAPDVQRHPVLLASSVLCSQARSQDSFSSKRNKQNNNRTLTPPQDSKQALPQSRQIFWSLLHLTEALVWVQLVHVLTETQCCWTRGWFSFLIWSWALC